MVRIHKLALLIWLTKYAVASGFTFLAKVNQLQNINAQFGLVQIPMVLDALYLTALKQYRIKKRVEIQFFVYHTGCDISRQTELLIPVLPLIEGGGSEVE